MTELYDKRKLGKIVDIKSVEKQGTLKPYEGNVVHLGRYPMYHSSNDGIQAMCGFGSYHMYYTGDMSQVTCKRCLSLMAYTIKYVPVNGEDVYPDLKPMSIKEAQTMQGKAIDRPDLRRVEVIKWSEYVEHKESNNDNT